MAADCEPTRAQMLELIYGELRPEARAEVDAHVAGCAACRAEVKALESTRVLARRSLAGDQPPPRAHAAIMRAAAAARPDPARAAAPVPKAAPREKPSAWAWLRGKWTLPTFATVGAVAVFVLASRIFLEPEKTYQRGREGLVPAEEVSAPHTVPPAAAPVPAPAEGGGAASAATVPEPPPSAKPAGASARKRRGAPAARADQPAMEAERAEAERGETGAELLAPPARRAAPPPAPEFAPAPPAAAGGQALDRADDEDRAAAPARNRSFAGAAPAPAPSPRAKAQAAKKAEAPDQETFAAPAASGAAAPPPRSAAARESPVARADRLFGQARWVEAAVAYRKLLRNNPRNADAPRWRQRLTACEAAARAP